jgi:hypothetical protein
VLVVKPTSTCDPAFQGGGTFVDPGAYATCYAVKPAPGAPRFAPRAVTLADAFGDQQWELRRPTELCLAATRDGSPVDPSRDALVCYQAKTLPGTPRVAARTIEATEETGTAMLMVQKPATFCLPARLDATAAADPAARLACYRAKPAPGSPRPVPRALAATDAFGTRALTAVKPTAWCQPATASIGP